MISRRKFLIDSAKFASSLIYFKSHAEPFQIYDCIVLGAGVAGVAAAKSLVESRRSVLVLEGSERVGGRVFTKRIGFGAPVELGAEYIHRAPGSVSLWNEIERLGIKTITVPKRSGSFVHTGEDSEMETMEVHAGRMSWSAMFDMIGLMAPSFTSDVSAQTFVDRLYATGLDRSLVQMALNGHLPAQLSHLSVDGYRSDDILTQLREPNDYSVIDGFDQVAAGIAHGLDIRFGRKVVRVRRSRQGVEIETSNGELFYARSAIITFSVNMLKSGVVHFDPPLPLSKLEALQGIGMGDVAKAIIQFDEPFWPKNMAMLHWPSCGCEAGRTYFQNFYGRKRHRAVLSAYLVGEAADRMRQLSDDDVILKICSDLDQVFPRAAPTLNKVSRRLDGRVIFSRKHWIDDPFAKGGYSFIKFNPGARTSVTKLRSMLKDPKSTLPLFWAGEAASTLTQPASVHGAHSSGLEAARAVHNLLK